jgi:hypothetical protein
VSKKIKTTRLEKIVKNSIKELFNGNLPIKRSINEHEPGGTSHTSAGSDNHPNPSTTYCQHPNGRWVRWYSCIRGGTWGFGHSLCLTKMGGQAITQQDTGMIQAGACTVQTPQHLQALYLPHGGCPYSLHSVNSPPNINQPAHGHMDWDMNGVGTVNTHPWIHPYYSQFNVGWGGNSCRWQCNPTLNDCEMVPVPDPNNPLGTYPNWQACINATSTVPITWLYGQCSI